MHLVKPKYWNWNPAEIPEDQQGFAEGLVFATLLDGTISDNQLDWVTGTMSEQVEAVRIDAEGGRAVRYGTYGAAVQYNTSSGDDAIKWAHAAAVNNITKVTKDWTIIVHLDQVDITSGGNYGGICGVRKSTNFNYFSMLTTVASGVDGIRSYGETTGGTADLTVSTQTPTVSSTGSVWFVATFGNDSYRVEAWEGRDGRNRKLYGSINTTHPRLGESLVSWGGDQYVWLGGNPHNGQSSLHHFSSAAIWNRWWSEEEVAEYMKDPYRMYYNRRDLESLRVYPRQRDFSQKRIPKFASKPPSWNIDPTLVDPELEQFVSNAKLMIPVLEQGNSLSVYGTGDNPVFQGNAKVVMTEYGPALDFDGTNGTRVDVSSKNILELLSIASHTGSYWTLSLMRCRDVNTRQTAWGSHINIWHSIEIAQSGDQGRIFFGSYGSPDATTPGNFINDNDLVLIYTEAQNVSGSGWVNRSGGSAAAEVVTKIYAHNLTTGKFCFDAVIDTNPSVSTAWGFTLGNKANTTDGTEFNGQIFYWIGGSGLLNFTESPISVFDGQQTRLPGTPISEKLINDPFAIFRQHKDTIHTNVYPIQRNYTQDFVRKIPPRPPEWNIDSNYTDPDAPKPIFAWEAYARGVDQPGGGGVDSYGFLDWVSGQWAGYARQGLSDLGEPTSFKTAEFGTYWDTPTNSTFGNMVNWSDNNSAQTATPSVHFVNGEAFRSYDIAWEALVYVPSNTTKGPNIFEVGNFNQGQDGSFKVEIRSSDQTVSLTRRTSGLDQGFSSPTGILPLDRWVHIVIQRTRDKGILYIDGKIVHTQNFGESYTVHEVEGYVEIGDSLDSSHFQGGIAHIRVYNEVLGQDKIIKLAEDPFWPIRHKQDTIHTNVYPMERNYSKGVSAPLNPWNVDSGFVDQKWGWFWEDARLVVPFVFGNLETQDFSSGKHEIVYNIKNGIKRGSGPLGSGISFDNSLTETSENVLAKFQRKILPEPTAEVTYVVVCRRTGDSADNLDYLGRGITAAVANTLGCVTPNFVRMRVNVDGTLYTSEERAIPLNQDVVLIGKWKSGGDVEVAVWNQQTGKELGRSAVTTNSGSLQTVDGIPDRSIFIGAMGERDRSFTGIYYSTYIIRKWITKEQEVELVKDPFGPIKHYQETDGRKVYPMQRNYSQNRIIYKLDKPKPWNI